MEVSDQLQTPAALFQQKQSPIHSGLDAGWSQQLCLLCLIKYSNKNITFSVGMEQIQITWDSNILIRLI